jgi:hypothetical protein
VPWRPPRLVRHRPVALFVVFVKKQEAIALAVASATDKRSSETSYDEGEKSQHLSPPRAHALRVSLFHRGRFRDLAE